MKIKVKILLIPPITFLVIIFALFFFSSKTLAVTSNCVFTEIGPNAPKNVSPPPNCADAVNPLAPGKVPLYKQWDPKWGNQSYGCGGTTIHSAGCGVTSLAMVISYNSGKEVLPSETTKISLSHGWRICGSGTAYAAMTGMPPLFGLKSKSVSWTEAKKYLAQGIPIIQSHGAGYFTSGGHYIVLTGISNGKYLVNDPDGRHIKEATEGQITASSMAQWVITK